MVAANRSRSGARQRGVSDPSPPSSPANPQPSKRPAANPVHVDTTYSPADTPPEAGRRQHGRQARPKAAAGGGAWWAARPWLPYALVALSLLGAFFLGAKLGTIPEMQQLQLGGQVSSGRQQRQQQQLEQQEQRGDKVTAEANGVFPQGCKWREVYYKVRRAARGAAGGPAPCRRPACVLLPARPLCASCVPLAHPPACRAG